MGSQPSRTPIVDQCTQNTAIMPSRSGSVWSSSAPHAAQCVCVHLSELLPDAANSPRNGQHERNRYSNNQGPKWDGGMLIRTYLTYNAYLTINQVGPKLDCGSACRLFLLACAGRHVKAEGLSFLVGLSAESNRNCACDCKEAFNSSKLAWQCLLA